jgi:hypothetical protein
MHVCGSDLVMCKGTICQQSGIAMCPVCLPFCVSKTGKPKRTLKRFGGRKKRTKKSPKIFQVNF